MASTSSRQRTPTPCSERAAYPWILDHVFKYDGSYELPLRTMYELNQMQNAHQRTKSESTSAFTYDSATGNAFASSSATENGHANKQKPANVQDRAALFKANLMSQAAQRPSQPSSLPPSFVTSFTRRCFPFQLEEVDFAQALAALDYLKDFENTRKKGYEEALKKLGVPEHDDDEAEDLAKRYPGVSKWVVSIQRKNRFALAFYTQVYLRLRHWTLVHEIMTTPFNRANCIAMLNTLFPPFCEKPPTPHINERTLKEHRNLFFSLIRDFQKKGKVALDPVLKRDAWDGNGTGWPAACEHIENYLRSANEMIEECYDVRQSGSFEEARHAKGHKGRKVDSGISFGTNDRASTSSSTSSSKRLFGRAFPSSTDKEAPATGGSTLERIAREIRKIKSRPDIGEVAKENAKQEQPQQQQQQQSQQQQPRGLKKVRSARFLRPRTRKSEDENDEAAFDSEFFQQKRMEWEKEQAKRASG